MSRGQTLACTIWSPPTLGCALFPHRVPLLLRGFPDARRKRSSEGGLEEGLLPKLSLNRRDRRELDLNQQGEGAACCLQSLGGPWCL